MLPHSTTPVGLNESPPRTRIDDSNDPKLLSFVLGLTAGTVDVIGCLGLGGLLIAHITSNLVFLAARLASDEPVQLSYVLAVPVFIVVLLTTRVLAPRLERMRIASLLPALFLQFVLLLAFYTICHRAGPRADPNSASMIFAGMLGVSAMAVQNALARVSLSDAPSMVVITTNITAFTFDIAEMLLSQHMHRAARARDRARNTWPAIAGFVVGYALGAVYEHDVGLQSLALPTVLALLAFALALSGRQTPPGRGIAMTDRLKDD